MKVFLSYSSKDAPFVEEIDERLRRYAVNIIRDKRDLKPMTDITDFMKSVKEMDYALTFISENYFCSTACLFEFNEFLKKPDAKKFLLPVKSNNFKLQPKQREKILSQIRNEKLIEKPKSFFLQLFSPKKKENQLNEKESQFLNIWNYLSNIKMFDLDELRSNEFKAILTYLNLFDGVIEKKLDEITSLKDHEDQDIAFDNLILDHPGSYWVIRYRAYICTLQSRYKKAINFYEKFLSNFSDPIDKISTYYDIGICYYKLKDYKQAVIYQEKCISIEPNAYLSYRALGDIFMAQEDYDQAMSYYLKSNQYQKDSMVLGQLGVIQKIKGKLTDAAALLNEAISLNPDEPVFYVNLYRTFQVANQNNNMINTLELALTKFPQNPIILTSYGVSLLFATSNAILDEPIFYLKKSFKIDTSQIDTRLYLSLCLILKYSKNKKSHALIFARDVLQKTLNMNITLPQKKFAVSNLKLVLLTIGDSFNLKLLKEKYPD